METSEIVSRKNDRGLFLIAQFARQGDRYAHHVCLGDGRRTRELLHSCEGTNETDWPTAPPLQQLTAQDLDGGRRVLLLVGQAGRSHWSLSVEPDEAAAALTFDVACRLQQEPEWLGSTYRWSDSLHVTLDGPAVELNCGTAHCRLLLPAADTADALTAETGLRRLSVTAPAGSSSLPRTVRWKYRLEVAAAE